MPSWLAGPGGLEVTVTFQGTGQYTIDETYAHQGHECTSHDVWSLGWTATFHTILDNGVLNRATGTLVNASPGSADMTVGGICAANGTVPPCQSTLTAPTEQPALIASNPSSPVTVEVQSIAGAIVPSCSDPTDGGFIGRDTDVFNSVVPGSLTGIVKVSTTELVDGSSFPVGSSGAPAQVPSDCTAVGPNPGGTLTSCSASLTWNGTITITSTPDCSKRGQPAVAPVCIDSQEKRDAAKAAADKQDWVDGLKFSVKLQCRAGAFMRDPAGPRACAGARLALGIESDEAKRLQQIADDPPDPNFTTLSPPIEPKAGHLELIHRYLPALARLIQCERKISGVLGALVTAQNRASGAYLALTNGNAAAAGPLAAQVNGVLAYAQRAASLFRSEPRLARAAGREIRSLAFRLRARVSVATFRSILAVAASLRSNAVTSADGLARAALNGIGT